MDELDDALRTLELLKIEVDDIAVKVDWILRALMVELDGEKYGQAAKTSLLNEVRSILFIGEEGINV
jgi:hypothetical protein